MPLGIIFDQTTGTLELMAAGTQVSILPVGSMFITSGTYHMGGRIEAFITNIAPAMMGTVF
jgi:hypothetical protein